MADNWNLRAKAAAAEDSNLPSLQCRVFDRIPVQDRSGKTFFYCIELCAGNSFDFGFCHKDIVPSLLRDIMTIGGLKVLKGGYDVIMIPSVPSSVWLKQARKYDPKSIIMWLEDSLELDDEYKDTILKLKKMGMRFAVRVDAMGEIASNEEVFNCIDYIICEYEKASEFMTVVQALRLKNPKIKTIAFKKNISIYTFNETEAKNFDYVLGAVQDRLLKYEHLRPKWQHEMLRTLAQLYSSMYDVKEISTVVANYPLMSSAMKGMVSSKQLVNLTIKKSNAVLAENQSLTQEDLRNFLVISVAYNLFTLTQKQICEHEHVSFDLAELNYEPFIQALSFGKVVDQLAQRMCDDITIPQAFIAGFLRYSSVFLHDTPEATFEEFPLDAVSTCYKDGGGQLGIIIRVISKLLEHRVDDALNEAAEEGITLVKEELYSYIAHSFIWADAVIKAIGIIKDE
ncbi:MAG: hypothetical protein ACI4ND_05905 [Succinivibrio sp.]